MMNFSFERLCQSGHLKVAQWLFSLRDFNIHVLEEQLFIDACISDQLEITPWLYSLGEVNGKAPLIEVRSWKRYSLVQ
jgi:hypothetical protein